MRVLGIDPGYDRCGIAVVEKQSKEVLIFSDCVTTDRTQSIGERLHHISKKIEEAIVEYKPDKVAIEKLFFNNNAKTAGAVAEARGMVLTKAAEHNLPVAEFTPGEIKVAVTGYGKSDKKQVIFMVGKLLKIEKSIKLDDEYDAIAVALTSIATRI